MTIQDRKRVLNRLTGSFERMTPAEEAAYHIALCLYDLADPTASVGRKKRASNALVYWRDQA